MAVKQHEDDARARIRRPWYRLHLSTWLILLLAAVGLVLVIVPGESQGVVWYGPGSVSPSATRERFEHGWPWMHLARTDYDPPSPPTWFFFVRTDYSRPSRPVSVSVEGLGIPWLSTRSWLLIGDEFGFRPGLLAANVFVAISILFVVAGGWEWRRRRHRHVWQFNLWEMLVLSVAISLLIGWWTGHQRRYGREQEADRAIVTAGASPGWVYVGPDWLRKLAGQRRLDILHAIRAVDMDQDTHDESLRGLMPHLARLPYLEAMKIEAERVTDAGLEGLDALTGLCYLSLDFSGVTDAGMRHLGRLNQLRGIGLNRCAVGDAAVASLAKLENLERLTLRDTKISDAGLVHLAGLDNLEALDLAGTEITDAGLAHLKGLTRLKALDIGGTSVAGGGLVHLEPLSRLEELSLADTQVNNAGLAPIEPLTGLRFLDLSHTQVTDAGLRHLERLGSLESLSVWNTAVTARGAERLKTTLPGCRVSNGRDRIPF